MTYFFIKKKLNQLLFMLSQMVTTVFPNLYKNVFIQYH